MFARIDATRVRRIRRKLLAWYDRARRDLPWRRSGDPYAIWLSESMLQQTQVATVIPYYNRFLSRFPTVQSLAAADLDDVLRLWAGLGYYARARNLHRAARMIVSEFGGRFPGSIEELRRLPGVGAYTAAALASIAFGVHAATVDGNVSRVIARLLAFRREVRTARGVAVVRAAAARLLPRLRCGDFNQAMMELGATVCLPGEAARCPKCPLRSECRAFEAGTVARLPLKARKTAIRAATHFVAAVGHRGRWLARRRPPGGLWGGLWELPTLEPGQVGSSPGIKDGPGRLERMVHEMYGYAVVVEAQPFCDFRRQLSHRTIRFVGYVCRVDSRPDGGRRRPDLGVTTGGRGFRETHDESPPLRWLPLHDLESLGMSRAMEIAVEHLKKWTDGG